MFLTTISRILSGYTSTCFVIRVCPQVLCCTITLTCLLSVFVPRSPAVPLRWHACYLCLSPGPLLYHYADMPNEMSIELAYDDVRNVIEKVGFEIEVVLHLIQSILQSAHGELLWPAFVHRPSSCAMRHAKTFLLKHLLLWNHSLAFDQTSQEWSLGGPLSKLFKPFQLVVIILMKKSC